MPPEARLMMRLGIALWFLAGLATGWELLALQPPDSPFHLGVLAGPITQLRNVTFGYGCMLTLFALWERADRWLAWSLSAAASLHVAVLGYAAAQGMLAVQILDPRADARALTYLRLFAHALTLFGLAVAFKRSQSS